MRAFSRMLAIPAPIACGPVSASAMCRACPMRAVRPPMHALPSDPPPSLCHVLMLCTSQPSTCRLRRPPVTFRKTHAATDATIDLMQCSIRPPGSSVRISALAPTIARVALDPSSLIFVALAAASAVGRGRPVVVRPPSRSRIVPLAAPRRPPSRPSPRVATGSRARMDRSAQAARCSAHEHCAAACPDRKLVSIQRGSSSGSLRP